MKSNITTILFDLDGTLIDTNELIISTFLHTLESTIQESIAGKMFCHF